MPDNQPTHGEKAVGLSFNPGADHRVNSVKMNFAVLIDQLNELRATSDSDEVYRMAEIAITNAQTAQMWAVKALTWTD